MVQRIYATADQYEQLLFETPPADIERRIALASRFLDANVFRYCLYTADATTGLPTHPVVAEAFALAVCVQAQWGVEVGDLTGAMGAGWGNVGIGDVQLGRSVTAVSGSDSPGRQVAPAVRDALRSPGLAATGFSMGVTWA
ncbi:hypothetical protein [Streptomyces sp. NPDC056387]|uniref:hypothetical protein n=1 Tax=Streptomyces sp. NPDC056387 TaxID=3345803 RepID=UPI0035D762AD